MQPIVHKIQALTASNSHLNLARPRATARGLKTELTKLKKATEPQLLSRDIALA